MERVMTLKMSEELLEQLERRSQAEGCSKGALLREVLRRYLEGGMDLLDQVTQLTELLRRGKKPRLKVDWEALRQKCEAPDGMTLEEEMSLHRRRRL